MKKSIKTSLVYLFIASLAVAQILWTDSLSSASGKELKVFAAASLTNVVTEIGKIYGDRNGIKLVPSFASSSTLAKQIENGAPAGVFVSADLQWMNYLDEKKLIVADSRFNLLGNRLALIAPESSDVKIKIEPKLDLAKFLGNGLLATGDPDHVPAGKYAKAALEKLEMWSYVSNKLARANDVRSALAWVEKGESPLGIVYSTDAAISKRVKVVDYFPEGSYPPIVYPAALIKGSDSPEAKGFLEFLKSNDARTIFEKYGFVVK
ncbi:MAG: molybdate ABC transporter substrate-binding protein [Syntrophaceae bacterium]|nr:molybdate ABC transporter substrate-binding protein [Syntrophaceae bacterium]